MASLISQHSLEDQDDAVIDPGFLVLSNALCDPHDIPDLLFPEPHVGEEHAIMELLLKGEDKPPHFFLVEHLVQHLSLSKAHLQAKAIGWCKNAAGVKAG